VRRRASRVAKVTGGLAAALLLTANSAAAFTIQSPATRGCHEEVTIDAWRRTQAALPEATAALPSSGDDAALIRDVPFTVPEDLQEIGLVTLLLGVRQNDISDLAATGLSDLAQVNSDPSAQRAHCLRSPNEDEPLGTERALDDCHAYILEELTAAIDALGSSTVPNASVREELEVSLAIRGKVKVRVPAFHLHAAHGIHALEDSFTHTFRNPDDPLKVRVVLNFTEYAENKLDEKVDGPAHRSEMDQCDDADALRTERHALAIEAGAAALQALLEPPTRAAKLKAVNAVITKYTSFDTDSHCTFDNNWCDAPENSYKEAACACRAAGAGPRGAGASFLAGALAFAATLRRRRGSARRPVRGKARKLARTLLLSSLLGVLAVCASHATAQAAEPGATEPKGVSGPLDAIEGTSNAAMPGKKDSAGAFFARVALGASYDKPGFSGGVGLRYQLSQSFMLGFDGEWNPWLAVSPGKVRAGAINGYFSLIRRFQLRYEAVNIRTTISAGGSYLMFDLVGAPKGSFGPFLGLSFLGVEWKVARGFYLTIDPTNIAFPIPHVTGVPFGYLQYRFLVGLEFGG
jgi:hypothetical protein